MLKKAPPLESSSVSIVLTSSKSRAIRVIRKSSATLSAFKSSQSLPSADQKQTLTSLTNQTHTMFFSAKEKMKHLREDQKPFETFLLRVKHLLQSQFLLINVAFDPRGVQLFADLHPQPFSQKKEMFDLNQRKLHPTKTTEKQKK